MKSLIFSLVLICTLSVGNLFAQGRGGAGGRTLPDLPTRPEPTINRPTETNRGTPQNPTAGQNTSEGRKAQGTNDPSVQLANNSGLTTQVAKLFPEGTDLGAMSSGFKNLGQFVAAAHLSKNLDIPFDQLKTKMVTEGDSLSDAVHSLKPALTKNDVKTETKKAEDQSKKDLNNKG